MFKNDDDADEDDDNDDDGNDGDYDDHKKNLLNFTFTGFFRIVLWSEPILSGAQAFSVCKYCHGLLGRKRATGI